MFGPPLAMALLLVVAGVGSVFVYARVELKERRLRAGRINLMIGEAAPKGADADDGRTTGQSTRFRAFMRLPFSAGIARTWGAKLSTTWLYVLAIAGAVATWLLVHGLIHLPAWSAAALTVGVFFITPRLALIRQQRRAEQRFIDLFPDTIDMIIRMMRAGLPVAVAIRSVGEQAMPPVSDVFIRIADRSDIGMPLEDALSDMANEIGLADFHFFAVSVGLQRATGGNLARTLEIFGEIVRKRRAVRLKASAATAEVRMSAMVLVAIPILVVAAMAVLNPSYLMPLISDRRGNILVGLAIASMGLGGLVMRWVIKSGTRV